MRVLMMAILSLGLGASAAEFLVDDFSKNKAGEMPKQWHSRGKKPEQVYAIASEDGNQFLQADSRGKDVWLGVEVKELNADKKLDPKDYPYLSWRWRVNQLPEGADERQKKLQDSAAAVYVVFPGLPPPRTIKYVWSSSVPEGSVLPSPYTARTQIIVLHSGSAKAGQWITEKVNYYEDYRRLFKEDPSKVRGVSILSDGDATKSRSAADYDDIKFLTP